jgi:putative tryptophan/tyrosine transport system substrate-binding protein
MRRRDFLGVLGSAAAAWPLQLRAQQPPNSRRIAFVHSGIPAAKLSESGGVFWIKTFYEELRKLGYAEGTNLVVERC